MERPAGKKSEKPVNMTGIITDIIFCCCGSVPAGDMRICRNITEPMSKGAR
jgi:hypothetical protein